MSLIKIPYHFLLVKENIHQLKEMYSPLGSEMHTKVSSKQITADLSFKSHPRYYSKKSNREKMSLQTRCGPYEEPRGLSFEASLYRTLQPFSTTLILGSLES